MYMYKKPSRLKFAVIMILVAIACFAGGYYGSKLLGGYFTGTMQGNSPTPPERLSVNEHALPTEPPAAVKTNPPEATYMYIAKEYNGNIGIFSKNKEVMPQFVINVTVSNLPFADREMLREGIILKNESDLTRLIEDYTS